MEAADQIFDALPRTAETHFRLFFHAAVSRVVSHLEKISAAPEGRGESFPFLAGYDAELRAVMPAKSKPEEAGAWWRERIRTWEAATKARLPLRALTKELGFAYEEQLALVLAGLVEEDIRFGSLFAALQEPLVARRPCLGLLGALSASDEAGPGEWWDAVRRLIEAGLLAAENKQAPRAEWVMRVPVAVWDALRGRAPQSLGLDCVLHRRREFPPLKSLVLEESLHTRLARMPAVVKRGSLSAVVLRGMADSGRRTLMGSLARAMRRDLLFCDRTTAATRGPEKEDADELGRTVGPVCTLTGAFPVFAVDPAPGETYELPQLAGYRGAVGVVMRREGGVGGPSTEQVVTLNIPAPAADHRRAVWAERLGERAGGELEEMVERFLLPLGSVHRVAGIASAYAQLDGREEVTTADAQLACRSLNRQKLDTLAQRLEVSGSWGDLVVDEVTANELYDLERRCRLREQLIEHVGRGFRNSVNRGVRALFNGPSGTGKTLAAKILAAVLQTDVYRVDLASVVNKYIGETEKNLSQLLARAEELDVILLVDEGDALMTNRTDVKSANDRYANLETNYLLQRLENYEGVVIVTTNAGNRIDQAFQRRFDMTLSFQPPDAHQRRSIWQRHLPDAHRVTPARLQEISAQCALTGGQIRNAVLYATLLAVDGGAGTVGDEELEAAVRREYLKAGASCPLSRRPHANGHRAALSRFVAEIR